MRVLKRWATRLRDHRRAVTTTAVVLIGGLVIAWVLFVPVADWLATHDVGPVTGAVRTLRLQTARDAARGRLLTLGAGLFAIGALWFTARNFNLSREGQVTDRYTKAIEQLGSDKLDVRIGGIYALERVSRDSPRDHPTVMEVLAAFVREHSREQWPPAEPGVEAPQRATRPDVQAAITVVGRRDTRQGPEVIDLTRADLTGADLSFANLAGGGFQYAVLSRADLVGAILTHAILTGAYLIGTYLQGADLTGAHLAGADLSGAYLSAGLAGAHLQGADLSGADLSGADLTGAYLRDADLTGADLADADLTEADLTGAKVDEGQRVPEGWVRDLDSGRLRRASEDTDRAGN